MGLPERFFAHEEIWPMDFADWAGCAALPMPMKEKPIAYRGRQIGAQPFLATGNRAFGNRQASASLGFDRQMDRGGLRRYGRCIRHPYIVARTTISIPGAGR
jgi:hypothetical protein